jgi:uncharacterized protein (DUF427 family)
MGNIQAIWNGEVIAESDDTILVEGNHYFPPDTVIMKYLLPSINHTYCGWKGTASYYSLEVDGMLNQDAAWYYPETFAEAQHIQGRIAFWHGVETKLSSE